MNSNRFDGAQESRLRDSIARQTLLTTLGIDVVELGPGRVVLDLPYRPDLCQQHGYLHAGAVTTLADSACGYAALSLQPLDREVLTVEFKINLIRPALGDRFRATGMVVKSGRTLTITTAEVVSVGAPAGSQSVALMQATIMAVSANRP